MVPELIDTGEDEAKPLNEGALSENESNLLPEHCQYRDEGCDLAGSCLNCPFPQCIYEQPGGKQRWLKQLEDRNIDTVTKAQQRGEAYLRQAEVESVSGTILVPVNCSQQLYDVIDVTDGRVGLDAEKKRVLGLVLIYRPERGEYSQRLRLGAV